MGWALRIPVIPGQPLDEKACRELPLMLDGDDRLVCEQLLRQFRVHGRGHFRTVQSVVDGLGTLNKAEIRWALDLSRRRAGLKGIRDVEADQAFDERQDAYRRNGPRQTRIVMRGGALVEVDDAEAQRDANADATLARRRELDRTERAFEDAERQERQRAADALHGSELPAHLRAR